jgi:hypothetical protein
MRATNTNIWYTRWGSQGGILFTLKMEAVHSSETLIPTYGEWSAGKNMGEKSGPNRDTIDVFAWSDWGEPWGTSVTIAGVPDTNRTQHLPHSGPGVTIILTRSVKWHPASRHNDPELCTARYSTLLNIVTCIRDYRRGLDRWIDLLNTHRSQLQIIIPL